MKPASILSHAEGNRLHKLATALADLTTALLNGGTPKRRRRRRKAKATKATKTAKATKAKTPKSKTYPVESTTN